ncbi:MAG: acyl-CoA dehydrogenase family protein, partial [Gammaproteobacteria bacterium]
MEDFLLLDTQLTAEEKLLRDTVARFVSDEVTPKMAEAYEKAQFPNELIQRVADLGLLGMSLAPE